MKPYRPQFTIQRLMIAIAVVTCVLSGVQTTRRWFEYRDRYRESIEFEWELREASLHPKIQGGCGLAPEEFRERDYEIRRNSAVSVAKYMGRVADHYHRLSEKYAFAMRHPWQSFEPDPDWPADDEF